MNREVIDRFSESVRDRNPGNAYGIRYQGRLIRLRSGKSMWTTIGAAKNALHAHLHSTFGYNWRNRNQQWPPERDIYEYLVENEFVEFVELRE